MSNNVSQGLRHCSNRYKIDHNLACGVAAAKASGAAHTFPSEAAAVAADLLDAAKWFCNKVKSWFN